MLRYVTPFLLSALLIPLSVVPASARWRDPSRMAWGGVQVAGRYFNQTEGGTCYVYPQGRHFVFVNWQGDRARYAWSGPGQLTNIDGTWGASNVVTVWQNRFGRSVIRFGDPASPTCYWVSTK